MFDRGTGNVRTAAYQHRPYHYAALNATGCGVAATAAAAPYDHEIRNLLNRENSVNQWYDEELHG